MSQLKVMPPVAVTMGLLLKLLGVLPAYPPIRSALRETAQRRFDRSRVPSAIFKVIN